MDSFIMDRLDHLQVRDYLTQMNTQYLFDCFQFHNQTTADKEIRPAFAHQLSLINHTDRIFSFERNPPFVQFNL